jgi:hypothetical protein
MFNDLMDNIEWFFNIHDKNKDGFLSKDEVLTLSESMLVSVTPRLRGTLLADRVLPSSSLDMSLGTHIWALLVGSCQMRSSTEMRCCPRRLLGDPRIRTIHHRSNRINLI